MAKRKHVTRNDLSVYFGEMVRVVWEDIAQYQDVRVEDITDDQPLLMQTYGLCVHDAECALFIAHTMPVDRNDRKLEEDEVFRIPKRSIDHIDILEVTQ